MFQKETDTKSNKTQGIGKTYREIIYVIKEPTLKLWPALYL